ncbi:hypothetical protein CONCODRAFT_71791 [Conidiobolus coronatus NRRL 28638]|uniref:SCP domain-containing protein n=1 Tax=Conidiobolus coronatus (strain ATCC 28846 / CBS 209.66 / NRRL 28638) TaxID=796925 RepID=A0A137P1X2_CONC2|nr:hypothetical protein CONCODRAFT_71791 [Conidiobolus coronatus NRRL 28638]|eukprot:KXN69012.1 hypothetical protein CONCODRAFT_71791 [Conidiobolus coronatus NRRL 28638]
MIQLLNLFSLLRNLQFQLQLLSQLNLKIQLLSLLKNLQKKTPSLKRKLPFNPQVVLDLTNELRAQNGKKPLKLHPALAQEAYEHAKYMQSINDLTHDRPKGTSFSDNIQKAGLKGGIAENIVVGALTDKDVYNAWATSEGHKANMLGDYDYMGVAISGSYASQEFAHA